MYQAVHNACARMRGKEAAREIRAAAAAARCAHPSPARGTLAHVCCDLCYRSFDFYDYYLTCMNSHNKKKLTLLFSDI